MRKVISMGVAAVVAGGTLMLGAGAAHADITVCDQQTGATMCWDEDTQVITVYDTLADGDTAYAYIQIPGTSSAVAVHTTGGNGTGVAASVPSAYADSNGDIHIMTQRRNNAGYVSGETSFKTYCYWVCA